MKEKKKWICIALVVGLAMIFVGCRLGSYKTKIMKQRQKVDRGITIGFSQSGAESSWRIANTNSMMNTFSKKNGYKLRISNAGGKQENQIKAMKQFIKEKVDYIVLSPIKETGWTDILKQVKKAKISVIIADRMIKVKDSSLYTAWVGSDFAMEGWKMCQWMMDYQKVKRILEYRIVHIRGTKGSTAQLGRTKALLHTVKEQKNWKLLGYEYGDFTKQSGKEKMQQLIQLYADRFNVVYCENDDEALGAIDVLEKNGYKVGGDIAAGEVMVVSFDCMAEGLEAVWQQKISCDMECNPLHGPRVEEIINNLENGESIDKNCYVDEELFAANHSVKKISIAGASYPVTMINGRILESRAY